MAPQLLLLIVCPSTHKELSDARKIAKLKALIKDFFRSINFKGIITMNNCEVSDSHLQREVEREVERDTHTDTHTDTHRHTQKDRKTHAHSKTDRKTHTHTHTHAHNPCSEPAHGAMHYARLRNWTRR